MTFFFFFFIILSVELVILLLYLEMPSGIYPSTLLQAGLSMALGAFLAGLLLAETEFSLQVESDIAPYRGLLLGLFFMTVCTFMPLI